MKKKIAILGSTGSIGKSLINILKKDKKSVEVFLLTAHKNYKELYKQIKIFNVKKEIGALTYSQMLNSKGGIEADLIVTCINKYKFIIVTGASVRTHDKKHILKYLDDSVNFKDITDE